jgi:hypothetical protein
VAFGLVSQSELDSQEMGKVLFASDFGKLVPGWFYVVFALIAIIVVALFIVAGVGALVALVRIIGRLLSGDGRKFSPDRDSDGE